MFFWYFESRKSPQSAPLSLYLGGGPGATSLGGVTAENGPCYINPDSNSTTLNPWSWNNKVNMLYLDQPVQVGFSYDELVPSVQDLLTGAITPADGSETSSATSLTGILPSQNSSSTANTTANAARIIWQFTQIWLQDFPEYKTRDDRISVWASSVRWLTPLPPCALLLMLSSMVATMALAPWHISNPRTGELRAAQSRVLVRSIYTSTLSD
jgi:hypothetical protein